MITRNVFKDKKLLKKVTIIITAICFVAALTWIGNEPIMAATSQKGIIASGSCGKSTSWVLGKDGVLKISGTGSIDNTAKYTDYDSEYRDKIYKIVIEEGVTEIESYAFEWVKNVKSISIPASVTKISSNSFQGMYKDDLVKINVNEANKVYDSRNKCNAIISTASDKLVLGCNKTSIPNGIKEIGEYAFEDCSEIREINIPKSVTVIGNDAFSRCTSLKSVVLPEKLRKLGSHAFNCCSNLENISLPKNLKEIGEYAFNRCEKLTQITIPSNAQCGKYAFSYCGFTKVELPDGMKEISDGLFACSSLEEITIPSSVKKIGHDAFRYTYLKKVDLPNGISTVSNGAFCGCTYLEEVVIPSSVKNIEMQAFAGCSSLTSVTIPNGVTSIESEAFDDCSSLISITIPKSVTYIGNQAMGYTYDETGNYKILVEDLVIYGQKSSTAEAYAKKNGITFKFGTNGKSKLTTQNTIIKLSKTSCTYDGKAKKPTVKVLNSKGKALKKSNYTVSYSDNVKVGKATVIIKFKGNYTGTIKKTFTIKPNTTSITGTSGTSNSVTLTWKKQSKQTSGYQVQYATDKKFTKNKQTVDVAGIKKTSKKITGLSKKTTYYCRVRTYKTVNGKKYYSGWSKVRAVKTK